MQSPHGSAFRPSVMGRNGMVTSGHVLASQTGIQTMMAGGNAVDAAIATAVALGMVEPAGSGLGGDGFILIYWAETGKVEAVNGTGPAPACCDTGNLSQGWWNPHERHTERFGARGLLTHGSSHTNATVLSN